MKLLALLFNMVFFSKNAFIAKKLRAKKIRARKRRLFLFCLSLMSLFLSAAVVSFDIMKKRKEKKNHFFYGSRF